MTMKAAVIHKLGEAPKCEDFPDPTLQENEFLVHVKAVALENVDRAVYSGKHFSSSKFLPNLPVVVGFDGIGMLDDGRLVGFAGIRPPYGAMAEKAVVAYTVPVPEGVDAATAASVPASALSSLFPLKCGAKLQPDETVLINGATGFAGQLAVQVAKLLGAKRVVGTGRDDAALRSLAELGADAVIDLKQSDEQVKAAFIREAANTGYHVILDFLWGHPTELLIETLVPTEISFAKHPIRLIQIGEMAGSKIALSADAIRTSGLEIIGAGANITGEAVAAGTQQVWEWIKAGKLRVNIEQVALQDVESAWQRTDLHGARLVIVP